MMSNIFAAAQDSVKPVSMASGSQQRDLLDQTSEQEDTWQEVPPAAATHKDVLESVFPKVTRSPFTEKLLVIERKRKRQPHDHNHQENLVLDLDTVHVNMFPHIYVYFLQSNYFIISAPHVLVYTFMN